MTQFTSAPDTLAIFAAAASFLCYDVRRRGLPVAPDGTVTDAFLESLVVSGDEAIIAACLTELLEAGLDELLVMTVQVAAPSGEQARLARLIGQISLSHG